MYFDSHAHYNDKRFSHDLESVLANIKKNNVELVMNIADSLKSSYESVELSKKYDFVYSSVGIHPHESKNATKSAMDAIILLTENEKVKAIGETGLDYHYDFSEKSVQKKVFEDHLEIAKMLGLPIIIHQREALKDMLSMIKDFDGPGVFHCFSESVETMKIVLNKGLYISFAGPVTFKNAVHAVECAKYVPLDRFLIETDCPYLSPEPVRGSRNDSSNLRYIVKKIAEIKQISEEEIAKYSMDNAKKLFNIT